MSKKSLTEISAYITRDEFNTLAEYAKLVKLSISKVCRNAIREYINEHHLKTVIKTAKEEQK
ncbi:MAG TPA: hypothetical protein O0X39_01190 [Methanocorpusculum sp.]|nr:hypothetical protein [Methanocorpusculum sp.]